MRAWSRLRMVLYGEERQLPMANALDGAIVQIYVRHLEGRCSRDPFAVANYREAMVLSCDQHMAAAKVPHRVIAASMTIGQLGGGAPVCQTDQLMAEADSESRETGFR